MKKIATIICGLALLCPLQAQRSYSFSSYTSPYAELTGATKIGFAEIDALSGFYRLNEVKGETFIWYNTKFKIDSIKTIHIQPDANLRFDNDTALIIVDAAFTYLDSIDNTSSISYTVEGNSGEKVIKTQWKNLKARVGQTVNFVNVQIWVFQSTGIIEIHYGPSSSNNQSGFLTSNGPQVGMFFSRDNFTKCYEKLWVTGAPDAFKVDSTANYTFKAMSGIPVEGTVFAFKPRFNAAGLNDADKKHPVLVYPNPVVSNNIFIREKGEFVVVDIRGKEILRFQGQSDVDISALGSGIYFLRNAAGRSTRFVRI
jgi:hypothetical protein